MERRTLLCTLALLITRDPQRLRVDEHAPPDAPVGYVFDLDRIGTLTLVRAGQEITIPMDDLFAAARKEFSKGQP